MRRRAKLTSRGAVEAEAARQSIRKVGVCSEARVKSRRFVGLLS